MTILESRMNTLLSVSQRNGFNHFEKRIQEVPQDVTVNIAFLGEVKAGKTTLVNALIGQPLLPVMDTPTTAAITELRGGEPTTYTAYIRNPETDQLEEESIPGSELGSHILGKTDVERVAVTLPPQGILKHGYLIVDTPGVSSLHEVHEGITYGYLPFIDVAFIVIDIGYGSATESLIRFLKEKLDQDQKKKVYFLISKCDRKPPAERSGILKSFENSLMEACSNPRLTLVSGTLAQQAKEQGDAKLLSDSGIDWIEEIIDEEILPSQESIVEEKAKDQIKSIAGDLKALLDEKERSLGLDEEELDNNIADYKKEVSRLEDQINAMRKSFNQARDETISSSVANVKNYAPIIAKKVADGENVDPLISEMTSSVISEVTLHLSPILRDIDVSDRPEVQAALQRVLDEVSYIHDISSFLKIATTTTLTVFLVPSPTAAVGTGEAVAGGGVAVTKGAATSAGKEAAKKGAKEATKDVAKRTGAGFLKSLKFVGNVIKEIDPSELVGRPLEGWILSGQLERRLPARISQAISYLFNSLEVLLEQKIEEEYGSKLREQANMLEEIKKQKKDKVMEDQKEREAIKSDLESVERSLSLD